MGAVPSHPVSPSGFCQNISCDTHSPAVQHHGHLGRLVHIASKRSAGSASQTAVAEPCCPESWGRREPHTPQNNKEERRLCVPPLHQHAPARSPPSGLCHSLTPNKSQRGFVLRPERPILGGGGGGGRRAGVCRVQAAAAKVDRPGLPSPPARLQGTRTHPALPGPPDQRPTTAGHSRPAQHHAVNTAVSHTQKQGRARTKACDRGRPTGKQGTEELGPDRGSC